MCPGNSSDEYVELSLFAGCVGLPGKDVPSFNYSPPVGHPLSPAPLSHMALQSLVALCKQIQILEMEFLGLWIRDFQFKEILLGYASKAWDQCSHSHGHVKCMRACRGCEELRGEDTSSDYP